MPATIPTMPARKSGNNKGGQGEPARQKPVQLNLRVTDFARVLLERIATRHGMNLTHALEYSIRKTARDEGLWD